MSLSISFKRWCMSTQYEHTEVSIKTDNSAIREDNLSNEDLCSVGVQFLEEGLAGVCRYEVIDKLIDLGLIDDGQIVCWLEDNE